jgi:hypothetical protein
MARENIRQIVKMYAKGHGYDDAAGELIISMGEKAKKELIQLRKTPKRLSELEIYRVQKILDLFFPGHDAPEKNQE